MGVVAVVTVCVYQQDEVGACSCSSRTTALPHTQLGLLRSGDWYLHAMIHWRIRADHPPSLCLCLCSSCGSLVLSMTNQCSTHTQTHKPVCTHTNTHTSRCICLPLLKPDRGCPFDYNCSFFIALSLPLPHHYTMLSLNHRALLWALVVSQYSSPLVSLIS